MKERRRAGVSGRDRGRTSPAGARGVIHSADASRRIWWTECGGPPPQAVMRIALVRSGGFAGVTLRREIDTTRLPTDDRKKIEQLALHARVEKAATSDAPDSFEYEIDIDGAHYVVDGTSPAW